MAMMSTKIGLMSGPGVKLRMSEPKPATNINVKMPSVAPKVSNVITMALSGSTKEPKTRAMSRNVASTT